MKKLFTVIFLFSFLSFGQDNCRLGLEIVYPSAFGAADGSLTATFLGDYSGQYTVYKREIPAAAIPGNSFSGIDSASFVNTLAYYFYAIDDQSGDTISVVSLGANLGANFGPYYGMTDSIIFSDTIISPMNLGDCNGYFNYSQTLGANLSSLHWRPMITATTPWLEIASSTTTPIDSICAGQYKFFGDAEVFTVTQWMLVNPQVTVMPSFQLNASTVPSSIGSCTGEATAQVSGAIPPLTYVWDGIQGSATENSLCPGMHNLKVIDANLDSVTTVYGLSDSANYFNNLNSGNAADSVYILVENCTYDFNVPTDSVTIDDVQSFAPDQVIVTFSFWQMGVATTMIDTTLVNYTSNPAWYLDITVYCYTKIIGSDIVKCVATLDKTDLGVDEKDSNVFSVYPNPSKDKITVSAENFKTATIINNLGEIILTSENKNIDISNLSIGLYQILIFTEGNMKPINLRFIKN